MEKFRINSLRLFIALLCFLAIPFLAEAKTSWTYQESDLTADPTVTWGLLDNGLKYAIMPNSEPPGKASLRLFVDAGSLMEEDDQQGIAHFLEHLAFNGSRHFPEGNLVEYFQRIGMGFGADTNAHTGFDETVYKLELPKTNDQTLDEGIQLLRDFADGLLLESDEIEKERGVILSEKRARDSIKWRIQEAELDFLFPNALPSKRLPIGQEEVIQSVPRKRFLDFYRDWYVPSRMTVIVVGDITPEQVVPLLEKHFSGMKASSNPRKDPDMGTVAEEGFFVGSHYEAEATSTTVALQAIGSYSPELDTVAKRRETLYSAIANHILNRRFEVLAKKEGAPFVSARAYSHEFLNFVVNSGVEVSCKPEHWKNSLNIAEQELRKALTFGFTIAEVEEAKAMILSHYEQAVKMAATRQSRELAGMLIYNIGKDKVFTSPKANYEYVKNALKKLDPKKVLEALRELWQDHQEGIYIFVSGNALIKNPEKNIAATFQKSMEEKVTPPEKKEVTPFAYESLGKAGEILSKKHVKDIDVFQLMLKNNVHLNLKKTSFEKNLVKVSVRFGAGLLNAPKEKPGLAQLASMAFIEGGLAKHSRDELKSIFAGNSLQTSFEVGDDAFQLYGSAAPNDLQDLLRLMTAYIVAPGYREEGFRQARKEAEAFYPVLERTPQGKLMNDVSKLLASGDFRFGFPDEKDFLNRTAAETKEWLKKPLASSYMEISIVGDIDIEKTINMALKTFGTLPKRDAKKPSYKDQRIVEFPRDISTKDFTIETIIPKAVAAVYWPTDEIYDIQRTRRLNILASIFTDRLRVQVREETGESYSPRAGNDANETYTDYGLFSVLITAKPEQTKTLSKLTLKIAGDLAAKGATPDELDRALKPLLNGLKDWVRNNDYWMKTVLGSSQEYPQRLEWSRTMTTDYSSITLEEINALAKKYLSPKDAIAVTIVPEGK